MVDTDTRRPGLVIVTVPRAARQPERFTERLGQVRDDFDVLLVGEGSELAHALRS